MGSIKYTVNLVKILIKWREIIHLSSSVREFKVHVDRTRRPDDLSSYRVPVEGFRLQDVDLEETLKEEGN